METLRHEKQALLELQEGGEGEKSDLIASSQKALARAAQLVSDASAMRRREAKAVMNEIDCNVYRHMAGRFESLLPQSVVHTEISAVKGELMTSKAIGKAAKSLEGIAESFSKVICPVLDETEVGSSAEASTLQLSDEVKQEVETMIHQAEFANLIAEASGSLLRVLAAGQWPDLLDQGASTEIGSILGHSIPELDNTLGMVLKSLKKEGVLTSERSNIDSFRQTVQTTMQSLLSDTEREDGTLLECSWNPPGGELLKDATVAKFSVMGAAACLSVILSKSPENTIPPGFGAVCSRLEQASSQAANVCACLSSLDILNDGLVTELSGVVTSWKKNSDSLLAAIAPLTIGEVDVRSFGTAVDQSTRELSRLSSLLRSANLTQPEDTKFHGLSPENADSWRLLSQLVRKVRSIDGDEEDINFLLRAREIEHHLGNAVENEPKLEQASTKVVRLEKVRTARRDPRFPPYVSNLALLAESVIALEGSRDVECTALGTGEPFGEIKCKPARSRETVRLEVVRRVQQSDGRESCGKHLSD